MSRRSYLGGLARRAVPAEPGLVPPRRLVRALHPAPIDEPTYLAAAGETTYLGAAGAPPVAAASTAAIERARAPHDEPRLPVEDAPIEPTRPATSTRTADDADEPDAPPAPLVVASRVPPADFVFESPGPESRPAQGPSARRPALEERPVAAGGSAPSAPRAPSRPRPGTPPRGEQTRALTSAVAAAVQWTSSDETARASVHGREVEPPPTRHSPADLAPAPRPSPGVRPAPAERSARSDGFTGVHIGSIHVEVVPPPDPAREAPHGPPPYETPSAPAGSLALRVESHFGLHLR